MENSWYNGLPIGGARFRCQKRLKAFSHSRLHDGQDSISGEKVALSVMRGVLSQVHAPGKDEILFYSAVCGRRNSLQEGFLPAYMCSPRGARFVIPKEEGGSVMPPTPENMLGVRPIRPLVLSMSAPVMLSMLISAIYNLVDSIYVAQVSDLDFLALSYAYPVQLLMIACCFGLGVGCNALLSRQLGRKDWPGANDVACHGFFLYGLSWLVFALVGLAGARLFFSLSTQDPRVADSGVVYLTICTVGSLGLCLQFLTERLLQSSGHPAGYMIVQGSGAVLNLVLDPVFIFGLDMGVAGAAVATVLGQCSGGVIGLCLLRRFRSQFPISFRGFRPRRALIKEIGDIALPATATQSLSSFMTLGMNQLLGLWSETAVYVLGAYFKIQSFVTMPVAGINSGLVPILGYNYGARAPHRIRQAVRFGLQLGVGISLAGGVLLAVAALPLLTYCFRADEAALAMGVPALAMTATAFPLAAVSIVLSAALQSLGRSRDALAVALLRQLVLLLPVAALLLWLVPDLVWLAFFITETLVALLSLFFYRRLPPLS